MEEARELAALMKQGSTPLTATGHFLPVIGRLDRPIQDTTVASWVKGCAMDYPIKSGNDGCEWVHRNLRYA